ncbi:hypothetical protein DYB31_013400 [Aphanomyces astaci]|uniref:Uncharacterized protein n=1 Tax=Aphanomyces astaci TaxID=112090 RepID=A0A397ET71_APHAT|nr:hypothetical protein DYB31_013400 [Aphanomyces astaci]
MCFTLDTLASDPDELKDMNEAKAKFGTPFDKWTPIEVDAQATQCRGKAVQAGSAVATVLNETEQALKFGLFCMTLMYFRGLSLLQKQKNVWNTHASKPPPPTNKLDKPSLLQGERARQANRQRYLQLDAANVKAKIGLNRKYLREQERMAAYRQKLYAQHRLAKQETRASTHVRAHSYNELSTN